MPAVLHYPTPSYLPGPHPTLRSFYHSTLSYLSLPRYNHILPDPTLDPPASLPYPTPYNHILPRPTRDPPAILPCPTQSYLADYHPTQSYLIQPHPTLDSSTILPCPTLFLPHITLCTPHPAMEFITQPTPTTHLRLFICASAKLVTFLNIRVNAPDDALSCEVCLSRFPSSLPPSLVVGILTTVTVAAPFLLPSPRKGTMSTPATGKRKGPVVPDEVSSKKVSPVLRVVIKSKTHCYTKHWVSLFYIFFVP